MNQLSKMILQSGMVLLAFGLMSCRGQGLGANPKPENQTTNYVCAIGQDKGEPELVFVELFSPDGFPITNSDQKMIIGSNKYYAGPIGQTGTVMVGSISWEDFSQIPDGTPVYYGLAEEIASGYFGELDKSTMVDCVIRLEKQVEDK
ncbi:MAG: hypothetical protein DWQ07_22510 [Chloroflexi bacterium]|nr:MAG: hypothetical protein DWQ07_22510 [Chloroflexota bacterium]MBL1193921.1 hypothetical protein [Chloroflexota bacterium]NOH11215.1 hypothetical protein [Chloroflexota bacterium]